MDLKEGAKQQGFFLCMTRQVSSPHTKRQVLMALFNKKTSLDKKGLC